MHNPKDLNTTSAIRKLVAQALNERDAGVEPKSVQLIYTGCHHLGKALRQDLDRDRFKWEKETRAKMIASANKKKRAAK